MLVSGMASATTCLSSEKIGNASEWNFVYNYGQGSLLDDLHIALAMVCLIMPFIIMRRYFFLHPDGSSNDKKIGYGMSLLLECSLMVALISTAFYFVQAQYVFIETFWIFIASMLGALIRPVNANKTGDGNTKDNIKVFSSRWWNAVIKMDDRAPHVGIGIFNLFLFSVTFGLLAWTCLHTENQITEVSFGMMFWYAIMLYPSLMWF